MKGLIKSLDRSKKILEKSLKLKRKPRNVIQPQWEKWIKENFDFIEENTYSLIKKEILKIIYELHNICFDANDIIYTYLFILKYWKSEISHCKRDFISLVKRISHFLLYKKKISYLSLL